MKILADENIPLAREAFAALGDVTTLPGRALTREAVRDADLLLVRSVTRVNGALLAGSRVRFVATATIGTDHVDTAWLAANGIGFASAPGSNAESVARYVTAALLHLASPRHTTGRGGTPLFPGGLAGASIGVVGAGNVGSRVARNAAALGMTVLLNDPPRQRAEGGSSWRPLDEVLEADVVTFHVPLTRGGTNPTHHLVNTALLGRLKPGAVLINTARGAVADTAALHAALHSGRPGAVVLDVFEGEPEADVSLLDHAALALATPHIAGYSYDGKVRGTEMIHRAACAHLGAEPAWDPGPLLPPTPVPEINLPAGTGAEEAARRCVGALYDILADDGAFRAIEDLPADDRAPYFERLRKEYPVCREHHLTTVRTAPGDTHLAGMLRALQFRVE